MGKQRYVIPTFEADLKYLRSTQKTSLQALAEKAAQEEDRGGSALSSVDPDEGEPSAFSSDSEAPARAAHAPRAATAAEMVGSLVRDVPSLKELAKGIER